MPGKVAAMVKWNKRPLLDKMIDEETPVKELVAWCNDNGFSISLPTMYSYMKQRREATANGLTMELIHSKENPLKKELAHQDSPKRIRHDMELLDEVIQKGFDTLSKMDVISPVTAIKALEMKHKLTNGSTGGYTHYGLEEIKLREAAREHAITAVILEFVPVEQHDTVIQRMEDVTKAYYESIGLGEAYAQQLAREAKEVHA